MEQSTSALEEYIDYYNNQRIKPGKQKEPGAIPSSYTKELIY